MTDLNHALTHHDSALADADLDIWIGSEPTFTLRSSEEAQWLSQPLGGNKQDYALQMLRQLALRHQGAVILRTVGRQYSGEKVPRWSFGLYERRDGQAIWNGPADPLLNHTVSVTTTDLENFTLALQLAFSQAGLNCQILEAKNAEAESRLLVSKQGGTEKTIESTDKRLARASVHQQKTPDSGLSDSLTNDGYFLFILRQIELESDRYCIALDLPEIKQITDFFQFLEIVSTTASVIGLPHLLLQGYPPPVDHTVAWTTITPDPAVIEINQAPHADLRHFHAHNRELFEIAESLGLSAYRLQYNGTQSDSGGGGQFTLGGRTAENSPFFKYPKLLPRLIRYVNQHPSLSYWFATNYVGATSQSPRVDEATSDAFHELLLAIDLLERQQEISPEFLYNSLGPFLADSSGNTHRSELNIEKLWNTHLPNRGCLGLLEFRAFRMPYSPDRSVAIALLLRSIIAMLTQQNPVQALHEWKEELHDRFALPHFLRGDLNTVFEDLRCSGFSLGKTIENLLIESPDRSLWSTKFADCQLTIEQAVEFWPLVGDVASQEGGGSRLVDSSTLRLQISLQPQHPETASNFRWQLSTQGYQIPLRYEKDDSGDIYVIGLKYRDFTPWRGLHPSIEPTSPLVLYLSHPEQDEVLELKLHNWRADGIPYAGLPDDPEDARQRRQQRLILNTLPRSALPPCKPAPDAALTQWLFDLRAV